MEHEQRHEHERRHEREYEPHDGHGHECEQQNEHEPRRARGQRHEQHQPSHYRGLLVMAGLSFAAMYLLMYAMVDRVANVYVNVNQAYMAGLMAAPMVLIELFVMRSMYRERKTNIVVAAISALVFVACFAAIRRQTAVSDTQFVRSMIPHHAGAILMCEQADLRDPELTRLCEGIRVGQQAEIDQMKAKLSALRSSRADSTN